MLAAAVLVDNLCVGLPDCGACLLHQRSRLAKPTGLCALCFLGILMVQVRYPSEADPESYLSATAARYRSQLM